MNVIESCATISPDNTTEDCAKFIIDDTSQLFTLSDIMVIGRKYTFSCWAQSENTGDVVVGGNIFEPASEWVYCSCTFVADSTDLTLGFTEDGTYYIYHAQLELGSKATDWVAAPEDTEQDISSLEEVTRFMTETIATLSINADDITASVQKIERETTETIDGIKGSIDELNKKTELIMDEETVRLTIQNEMANGTSRVVTSTGFKFDDEGLTVDKSDSDLSTQITENGMAIRKHTSEGEQEMLKADSNGVDANNLHATTYLIVGKNSRFEDYGNGRTGCFWIGG